MTAPTQRPAPSDMEALRAENRHLFRSLRDIADDTRYGRHSHAVLAAQIRAAAEAVRVALDRRDPVAALRSSAGPDRVEARDDHRIEALKREAQDRAFRHELAESTLKRERERWLRAGQLALAGNTTPLLRIVERAMNPAPIQGSGVLSLSSQEERS